MRNKQAAYTLIEILIAMVIFAIIATITTGALFNILKLRSSNQEKNKEIAQLQQAITILNDDLNNVAKRSITIAAGSKEAMLAETTGAITFTRIDNLNAKQNPHKPMQRIAYRFTTKGLERQAWDVLDRLNDTPSSSKIILNSVTKGRWYFYDDKNTRHTLWPPVNQLENTLPRAIEVNFDYKKWGTMTKFFMLKEYPDAEKKA